MDYTDSGRSSGLHDRSRCRPHPQLKRTLCGADAIGSFNRDDFGLDAAKALGFNMAVTLRIQVEAIENTHDK